MSWERNQTEPGDLLTLVTSHRTSSVLVRFTKDEAIKELSNRRSAYLIEVIDHTRLIDNRVEYECEERIINVIEK